MPSFSVPTLWHTYVHCHPNRGSRWTHKTPKNVQIFIKTVLLEFNFQNEGPLYANCLFYTVAI